MNEKIGTALGFTLALIIKVIVGVVVPAMLFSHGLHLIGYDVPSNAIAFILLGIWLTHAFLIARPNKK